MTDLGAAAREQLLRQFRWINGHADIWAAFRHGPTFATLVAALAESAQDLAVDTVDTVVGVESRGFLLGGAVAARLGIGFVAVRKAGALFPGPKLARRTEPDYRANTTELLVQRAAFAAGDRVVLVDDWLQTGSQARAVRDLVTECGAELVGCAVLVDDLADAARDQLPPVHGVLRGHELPPID
jgi:adenine phosphoribosyltransferase